MISDILCSKSNDSPYFIVNTSAKSVALMPSENDCVLYNATGRSYLRKGDSFLIQSLGFLLPDGFVLAGSPTNTYNTIFRLYPDDSSGTSKRFGELSGGQEDIFIPIENTDMFLNLYIDVTAAQLTVQSFQLKTNILGGQNVSMLGAPTSINGDTYKVKIFMKILHTIAMDTI